MTQSIEKHLLFLKSIVMNSSYITRQCKIKYMFLCIVKRMQKQGFEKNIKQLEKFRLRGPFLVPV